MYLGQYLQILRRRWVSVVITMLVMIGTAALVTVILPTKYTATTRLLFAVHGDSVSDLAEGTSFAERQMSSYAEVARSTLVLRPVIERLELTTTPGELAESIQVTVPVNTVILDIAVTDSDPERAADIANAVGSELSRAAGRLIPERRDGTSAVQATTVAEAEVPVAPSSPNLWLNLGLGLVLGLIAGVGVAVLRSLLDTKVRSKRDVRAVTDVPILGTIAHGAEVAQHPIIVRDAANTAPAEAIRRVRTNLQFIEMAEPAKSIVITSAIAGEGKSTVAMNLAVALAYSGTRVVLIDADLRRPTLHEYMGVDSDIGLTTVLIGKAEVRDAVRPFGKSTLDLLPAGQLPPNPSEVLGSPAMGRLLKRLQTDYDMVLLDSSPLLPVTDAAVLSNLAGGALLVLGADRVRKPQLREALESLQTAGAHVLGIVMNMVKRTEARVYVPETLDVLPRRARRNQPAQLATPTWDVPRASRSDYAPLPRKPRATGLG